MYITSFISLFAKMTRLAPGLIKEISGIGNPKIALICNSNSFMFWLVIVTRPVSWGLGDNSENITSSSLKGGARWCLDAGFRGKQLEQT